MSRFLGVMAASLVALGASAYSVPALADCSAFLVRSSFRIPFEERKIKFSVEYLHGCLSGNGSYYVLTYTPAVGERDFGLSISTLHYPELKKALEAAIASRMENGLSRMDIQYYRERVIPLLQVAEAAVIDEEKELATQQAKDAWAKYLAGAQ